MNEKDFGKVVESRIDKIRSVLGAKAKEYASDTDRLHNFKKGAAMFGCTPETHCLMLASKHSISIADMVAALDKPSLSDAINAALQPGDAIAKWEEKIGDAINYLILLEGLVKERIGILSGRTLEGAYKVPGSHFSCGRYADGTAMCIHPVECADNGHCKFAVEAYPECASTKCPTWAACTAMGVCQRPKREAVRL